MSCKPTHEQLIDKVKAALDDGQLHDARDRLVSFLAEDFLDYDDINGDQASPPPDPFHREQMSCLFDVVKPSQVHIVVGIAQRSFIPREGWGFQLCLDGLTIDQCGGNLPFGNIAMTAVEHLSVGEHRISVKRRGSVSAEISKPVIQFMER